MKYKILNCALLVAMLVVSQLSTAREYLSDSPRPIEGETGIIKNESGKTTIPCAQASAFTDLDINNVRARIMNGGDMWWDRGLSVARYEVPKGSGKHSLFAGSVWIGGYDAGNNLKVTAQTYRQFGGNDYWPGPLNGSGATEFGTCTRWDKIWKIDATLIIDFIAEFDQPEFNINDAKWQKIREWPGYMNPLTNEYAQEFTGRGIIDFAPFVDVDQNGMYDPRAGDYPEIKGDQFLWWVFNDAGAIKTETNTPAIGMEVQASAFAFLSNDQLNNATFYNYKLFNRSSDELDSCFIGTFTDADLGYAYDDFVGCDTVRSLGILYNGRAVDGNGLPAEYGDDPPMIAIDFFEGPTVDSAGFEKELGMTSFIYFNNKNDARIGNPQQGIHFYRYISGSTRDGQEFTQTCTGLDNSVTKTKFLYWGDPGRPGDIETNWNECVCNNTPDDRRFVHSSGPFKLKVNAAPINVTIGAIWADGLDYPCPSFGAIQIADDKAQELFDRNFIPIEPPNAPILTIRELDQKLVLYLNNPEGSNNYNETYGTDFKEISTKGINLGYSDEECTYMFEGYKIFQVSDSSISTGDIYNDDGTVNTDVARLAFQCDIKNGVSKISNFDVSPTTQSVTPYYIEREMVNGDDKGLQRSFLATTDLFATGINPELVNYKRYYYIAVAYAYNNFSPFDILDPGVGQNQAYLESFKNGFGRAITATTGIPNGAYTDMGNQIRAEYGEGVAIKVLEGKGNGGNYLILSEESENQALFNDNYQAADLVYEKGHGPVNLKIIDPIKVPDAEFELWLQGNNTPGRVPPTVEDTLSGMIAEESNWFLKNITTGDTIYSERNLTSITEQVLADYGISLTVTQAKRAGDDVLQMGYIADTIIYDAPNLQWLDGVRDGEGRLANNWIRSGTDMTNLYLTEVDENYKDCEYRDYEAPGGRSENGEFLDRRSVYEGILNGTWAPYALAANEPKGRCGFGVAFEKYPDALVKNDVSSTADNEARGYFHDNNYSNYRRYVPLAQLKGVDIVFTPDRAKWSKCAVVEMHDVDSFVRISNISDPNYSLAEGQAAKFNLRKHASVLKEPGADGQVQYADPADYGTSWFPGYAINVETGERLNIFFGEDSYLQQHNGRDMLWNPTERDGRNGLGAYNSEIADYNAIFGGKHAVYVSNTKYDECAEIINTLKTAETATTWNSSAMLNKEKLYGKVIWMGLPLVANGYQLTSWKDGLIPTPTRIRVRTEVPYQEYAGNPAFTIMNNAQPRYYFSTKDQTMLNINDISDSERDDLLSRIRAVPNPYLAYSAYEWNRFDNRIKIINLPRRATVKIYSLDGVLIRTLTKDNETSFVEWDLKNSQNIAIAGGAYLMHVKAEGMGETVLKWFAAIRPTDITTF